MCGALGSFFIKLKTALHHSYQFLLPQVRLSNEEQLVQGFSRGVVAKLDLSFSSANQCCSEKGEKMRKPWSLVLVLSL